MELEEHIAELEAERDAMKRRREERLQQDIYDNSEEEGRLRLPGYGTVGTTGTAVLSSEETKLGHSDYGRSRSRRRLRTRHHHRTSLESGSRSMISAQPRHSKWSIKCYTVSGKEVRQLNCYELIKTSIRWCLDIEGLTVKHLHAFLEHSNFLSSRLKRLSPCRLRDRHSETC